MGNRGFKAPYESMQLRFEDFCKDESNVHIADLVLEGEFEHLYGGERVLLKAGMCQFLKPETFHKFEKSGKGENRCLRNIALSEAFFEKLKEPLRERLRGELWQPTLLGQSLFEQFKYKRTSY